MLDKFHHSRTLQMGASCNAKYSYNLFKTPANSNIALISGSTFTERGKSINFVDASYKSLFS